MRVIICSYMRHRLFAMVWWSLDQQDLVKRDVCGR